LKKNQIENIRIWSEKIHPIVQYLFVDLSPHGQTILKKVILMLTNADKQIILNMKKKINLMVCLMDSTIDFCNQCKLIFDEI